MFMLDTNVLSAIIGSRPAREVAAWVAAQPEELLFTASVCQAEILAGIEILPDGHRRFGRTAASLIVSGRGTLGLIVALQAADG